MKYGITEQLSPATLDLANRFHAALVQRLYQRQRVPAPKCDFPLPRDTLDRVILEMLKWDEGR